MTKLKTKKKYIVVLVVLLLVVAGVVGYWQLQPRSTISYELSDRSKEFIKSQSLQDGNAWNAAVLEEGSQIDTRNSRVNIGECFSFVMPYRVTNSRSEGECDWYFSSESPSGSIVTFMREGVVTDFDGVEGVKFRRLNTETYHESEKTLGGRKWLIFTSQQQSAYQATAFTYTDTHYLTFTLNLSDEQRLEADLVKMLESLQIHK